MATKISCRQDVKVVLLGLSAAFDTTDHTIFVERLESYFENLLQLIVIGDQVSTPCALRYGVPLESILGPLLFTLSISFLYKT